jgi:Uma2 family endonuclease
MHTDTITLAINPDKRQAFLEMLKLFDFVEVLEVHSAKTNGKSALADESNEDEEEDDLDNPAEKPLYYDPDKLNYTVEDIEAIAAHFPKNHRWTYQDLQKYFPQDLKISVQIIQNQLFIMGSPNFQHQNISEELGFQFGTFIRNNKLGKLLYAPMDIKFDADNIVQPDIIFVAVSRYEVLGEQMIEGAPNLVVEIWSPANKKKERNMKHQLYENQGVTEYWQIYPKKKKITIEVLNQENKYEVFSQAQQKGTIRSKVPEGFEMEIGELFGVE